MTRAPAIGLSRWLTIPEIGGATGEASTGEAMGAAMANPPAASTGKSQANAATRRRLITRPKVYARRKSNATGQGGRYERWVMGHERPGKCHAARVYGAHPQLET